MRSRVFDDALKPWLAAHPGGTVVEPADGLETQFQRCDDGEVKWLCVDVPDGIAIRSRFLPSTERCRYVAKSALDVSWCNEVDASWLLRDILVLDPTVPHRAHRRRERVSCSCRRTTWRSLSTPSS